MNLEAKQTQDKAGCSMRSPFETFIVPFKRSPDRLRKSPNLLNTKLSLRILPFSLFSYYHCYRSLIFLAEYTSKVVKLKSAIVF